MRYRVWHETAYSYDQPVTDSLGSCHLTPRQRPWQRIVSREVSVRPAPDDLADGCDYFGNRTTYFQVTTPHTELVIASSSEVEVSDPVISAQALAQPWESLQPLLPISSTNPTRSDTWRAAEYALASPLADHDGACADYAATSFPAGRPIGEAALELMHRIFADFEYDKTATSVTSTVAETMRKRAGVCQDFAQLTLACLRTRGIAARYVSGYLATQPPPGKDRVFGADASHAWVEVWLGDDVWLPIDPTNDQQAGDRYVCVAYGRDYGDVPPVKGVIFTEATRSTLRVSVDVAPVDDER